MRWLSLFLLTSVLTLGCKDEAKPSASDDTAADTAVEDSAPAASVKTTFEDPPMPEPDPSTKPAAVEPAEAANATMETTTGVAPAAPIRDLGAELRAAVGTPVECVNDFQPSSARTIRVSVRGVVRPTGMIIEPSASGGGLSRNDLRCIEERVGAVVLSPLGGQASEPVSTVIELEYTPPEVESFEVAPPPPPAAALGGRS